MFLLLIRVRAASLINIARDQWQRSAWRGAGLALLGILLIVALFEVFLFLFRLAAVMSLLTETVYQVYYFLFLFLLAGSTPFVASALLHSYDYDLLFSAPVPARSVVAAKLLDATLTNSLQFTVLGAPALAACAAAMNIPWAVWLLLPVLIALFVLVPALLTAFGLLILLAILGVRRLRPAITVLNAVMAAVACITIIMESPHLPVRPGVDALSPGFGEVVKASPAAHLLPCAWFADILVASTHPGGATQVLVDCGKILGLVIALVAACLVLGSRLISAANLAEHITARTSLNGIPTASLVRGPLGALLSKDWRYLLRDSILLSQLAMPLILFAAPFILTLQDPGGRAHSESFTFSSAIIGVIIFMQTSILSLSSIGIESRAYWLTMTAPVSAGSVLWCKLLLSTLVSAVSGVALTLVAALAFGAEPVVVLCQILFVVVSSASLSGLGVGLAATFPRFVYENPAHRVSTWALILGFFATTGYVILSGILFATAGIVSTSAPYSTLAAGSLWSAAAIYLLLSASAIFFPIRVGARRIESYQWEH